MRAQGLLPAGPPSATGNAWCAAGVGAVGHGQLAILVTVAPGVRALSVDAGQEAVVRWAATLDITGTADDACSVLARGVHVLRGGDAFAVAQAAGRDASSVVAAAEARALGVRGAPFAGSAASARARLPPRAIGVRRTLHADAGRAHRRRVLTVERAHASVGLVRVADDLASGRCVVAHVVVHHLAVTRRTAVRSCRVRLAVGLVLLAPKVLRAAIRRETALDLNALLRGRLHGEDAGAAHATAQRGRYADERCHAIGGRATLLAFGGRPWGGLRGIPR
jgi:hypothetical protein